MKAIVQDKYGSTDVLELKEIDKPTVKDDEVLVRVHAASTHPDVWHAMRGMPYVLRIMGSGLFKPIWKRGTLRGRSSSPCETPTIAQIKVGSRIHPQGSAHPQTNRTHQPIRARHVAESDTRIRAHWPDACRLAGGALCARSKPTEIQRLVGV